MTAQLTPKEELQRQRAIALINIINDANETRGENKRLTLIVEKQSVLIQGQQNLINELYDEVELRHAIDSTCAAVNIQYYNDIVDLNKKVDKQQALIKIGTWTVVGLATVTALLIIAK